MSASFVFRLPRELALEILAEYLDEYVFSSGIQQVSLDSVSAGNDGGLEVYGTYIPIE